MIMIDGVTERATALVRVVSRATPVPLGVRCGVFLTGLTSIVLAFPGWVLFSGPGPLLLLAPLLPTLLPKGRLPALTALLAIAGWLVGTTVPDARIGLGRLLGLAGSLYLLHSLAALAAVLPYDAVVPLDVVAQWLARALAVVLASAVLAVVVLSAVGRTGDGVVLAATVLGLGLAVAVAALLAWLWRRR